jgi:hypothetical protein
MGHGIVMHEETSFFLYSSLFGGCCQIQMDVVGVGIYSFLKKLGPHAFAHIHCTLFSDFKVIQSNFMKWISI